MTLSVTKTFQVNADKCLVDFVHYLQEEYPEIGPMDFEAISDILQGMFQLNAQCAKRKRESQCQ